MERFQNDQIRARLTIMLLGLPSRSLILRRICLLRPIRPLDTPSRIARWRHLSSSPSPSSAAASPHPISHDDGPSPPLPALEDHFNGEAQAAAFRAVDVKLERFVADARAASSHTLGCIPGCGKCCLASTVEVGQGGGVPGRARFILRHAGAMRGGAAGMACADGRKMLCL